MNGLNESDHALTDAFRGVAAEDAALEASHAVEARLRAEVRAIARMRRRRAAIASFAAAAVLAIATAVPAWRWAREIAWGERTAAPAAAADRSTGVDASAREVRTAFFPLTHSAMPLSNAQLVRLDVPRAALASFGLGPIDAPDGGSPGTVPGTVQADVLVGEDGVARAVRFVRQVRSQSLPATEEKTP